MRSHSKKNPERSLLEEEGKQSGAFIYILSFNLHRIPAPAEAFPSFLGSTVRFVNLRSFFLLNRGIYPNRFPIQYCFCYIPHILIGCDFGGGCVCV